MADKVEVVIRDMRTPKWIRSMVILGFLVFFPIGLGVYAGSAAMQWAGFFFGVICAIALAKEGTGEKSFRSPTEARDYLTSLIHKETNHD